MQDECSSKEGGVKGGICPAVEPGPKDGALVEQDGELAVDPVGHGQGDEEPEEVAVVPGAGDRYQHEGTEEPDEAEKVRYCEDAGCPPFVISGRGGLPSRRRERQCLLRRPP